MTPELDGFVAMNIYVTKGVDCCGHTVSTDLIVELRGEIELLQVKNDAASTECVMTRVVELNEDTMQKVLLRDNANTIKDSMRSNKSGIDKSAYNKMRDEMANK